MPNKGLPSNSAIVRAFRNAALADMIFSNFGHVSSKQLDTLIARCAKLHNTGQIDILSLARGEILSEIEPRIFFIGQHFFCKIIPLLDGPIEAIIEAVFSLVEKGGHDLAANQPNASFRNWCAVDIARSRDVIGRARSGDVRAEKLLSFSLEAWNMWEEAAQLLEATSDEIRLSAITALGRMSFEDPRAARIALKQLNMAIAKSGDELLSSNILVAALSITAKVGTAQPESLTIVRRVTAFGGATVMEGAAYALERHGKSLSSDVVELLLEKLASIEPDSESLVQQLDKGLAALLETDHHDVAVGFIRQLLTVKKGALDGTHFGYFGNQLRRQSRDSLWKILIDWLISGERVLCEWVPKLVDREGDDEPEEIPADVIQLAEAEKIFLARKVIGYLFPQPVCCASILVSIIRTCEVPAAATVGEMLFDPMLVSFSGSIRQYLEELPPDDAAYRYAQDALGKWSLLLTELAAPDAIKEIHPSQHERQIFHWMISDQMSMASKRALEDSILMKISHQSAVLYGRRALGYFNAPNQPRQAVEMDLHPHSLSTEVPLLMVLDPVGLELLIQLFRAERFEP